MSDILIKNMEMPKEPIAIIICTDGKVFRVSYPEQIAEAISVPDHGKLIDADALCVEINKICDRRDAGIITDLTCLQQILSALRHAPTIIKTDSLPVFHSTTGASSKEEAERRLTGEVET